ncbi:MAG: MetQ/NlpA family ABC transporter substrate-binding protein [Saccharofermentans sp.]|nr:MetQ/NlpA family ABC transporter substrate-binding protein [Saccharofermentans sp.]
MKKFTSLLLIAALSASAAFGFTACSAEDASNDEVVIAIPNDTTNEARALLLLQELGYITIDPDAGIAATPIDVIDNPHNITFQEVEAAQLPTVLSDVDYAVINSNYAIDAGLVPTVDGLGIENSASAYVNILVVEEGNEDLPEARALVAALESQQVYDFIIDNYDGGVVPVVENRTNGYDDSIDYAALAGTTISVAATPSPHAEILAVVADILAEYDITLDIVEFNDYVQPNNVVEEGEIFANYFQHVPYLDDFNAENGTHLVSISGIHVEPMAIYGGQQANLDALS